MPIRTILSLDDSEADHYLNELAIREVDSDIRVVECFDGQEALELLEAADPFPDVIFVDINMPRMDGFEFLDRYFETWGDTHESTTIMILTSSLHPADRARTEAYPFPCGFMSKPLPGDWLRRVEGVRDRS